MTYCPPLVGIRVATRACTSHIVMPVAPARSSTRSAQAAPCLLRFVSASQRERPTRCLVPKQHSSAQAIGQRSLPCQVDADGLARAIAYVWEGAPLAKAQFGLAAVLSWSASAHPDCARVPCLSGRLWRPGGLQRRERPAGRASRVPHRSVRDARAGDEGRSWVRRSFMAPMSRRECCPSGEQQRSPSATATFRLSVCSDIPTTVLQGRPQLLLLAEADWCPLE